MKDRLRLWGGVLIAVGIIVVVNRLSGDKLFNFEHLWPFLITFLGLGLELSHFKYKVNPMILVPGGILTTIGLLHIFEVFTKGMYNEYAWPVYLIAVAIGIFQMFLADRHKGLLIPVFILVGIAVIAYATMIFENLDYWVDFSFILGLVFVVGGIYLFRKNFKVNI